MVIKYKVYAYITRGSQLLVFKQPDFPEAGVQVPGGTMEAGELPAEAVMREAQEETGLTDLTLVDFLGEDDFDMAAYGREEIHHRYFYHLICPDDVPATWTHGEFSPSEGDETAIRFDFYWLDLTSSLADLIGWRGALLHKLLEKV